MAHYLVRIESVKAFGHEYTKETYTDGIVYYVDGAKVECTQTDACTCGDCGSFLPSLFEK